jgi:hypothetical protein
LMPISGNNGAGQPVPFIRQSWHRQCGNTIMTTQSGARNTMRSTPIAAGRIRRLHALRYSVNMFCWRPRCV